MSSTAQAARTKSPPGPRQLLSFSTFLAMRRDPLTYMEQMHREYGDIISYFPPGRQVLMLFHPDMTQDMLITHARHHRQGRVMQRSRSVLGNGLLTSEGSFHLRPRRLIQPAFHRQRVFGYGLATAEYAERQQGRWKRGEVMDVHREMMRLTLALLGKR